MSHGHRDGRAFPDHTVPDSTVRDVADRHDVQRHVARFEKVLEEIAAG